MISAVRRLSCVYVRVCVRVVNTNGYRGRVDACPSVRVIFRVDLSTDIIHPVCQIQRARKYALLLLLYRRYGSGGGGVGCGGVSEREADTHTRKYHTF